MSQQEVTEYSELDPLVKGSINMFEEIKDSIQTGIPAASIVNTSIEENDEEDDYEEYLGFESFKKQK